MRREQVLTNNPLSTDVLKCTYVDQRTLEPLELDQMWDLCG